jgi:hypothetical protein
MKPIVSDTIWVERGKHYGNKLFFSLGDLISCFIVIVYLLVGAWLFAGTIVSFVFLLLSISLFGAIVFHSYLVRR